MLLDLPYRHAALVALCLVPAAVSWWSGRSLIAALDDPLLPERLLAHRRRNLTVLWLVIVGTLLLGTFEHLIWTIPLTIVARAAARYPLRRALYDERWSFAAYMAAMSRLLLAFGGFRLLLACAPLIAGAAGSLNVVAAIAIGVLLFLWHRRSPEALRVVLRAQPLGDSALVARFQAIAAASAAPPPRFELVDLGGGAIANAIALPSLRGSSVLYTDTLLRLLDADEATAITAHEIAHLEYYDAARLRTLNRTMTGLILGATGAALLPRLMPGLSLWAIAAAWCAVYVAVLGWIARDRQRNETASDLRAVQLGADADALVRALIKVHTFARLPRRWDTRTEQSASHPSLARRIRAIRAAAGTAQSAALPTSESVRGADGRTVIGFADALHWQESEGVLHVLAYAQLTELRLDTRTRGGTRLVAVERGGRRWEAALDAAESARAQAILDRVDGRLAEPAARSHAIPWLQATGAVVAISALWAGQLVVALVALAASMRSAAAFFAAAGAASLGAAALVGRRAVETGTIDGAWPAPLLAVLGVALLAGAWRRRGDEGSRFVDAAMAGLAVLASISVAAIAWRGADAVRLYQASVALPSASILPIALAAALAIRPRRAWRLAAVPICLVGVIAGVAGSGVFLHAFGRDPFLVSAAPLPVYSVSGEPTTDVRLPGLLTDLRLSPHGTRMALLRYLGGARYLTSFSVGIPGSALTPIAAADLLFLDDERVLAMTVDETRTRLQAMTLATGAVTWERSIDGLAAPRLAYRRASNRWMVSGVDVDGRIVSANGIVGSGGVTRRDWTVASREEIADAWAIDGDTALRAQRTFGFDPLDGGALNLTMAAMLSQMDTRVTRITPRGETQVAVSRLDTMCSDRALDGERLVCLAYDGTRTHVLAFAPAADAARPIGSIGGRFMASRPTREGVVSGWMTTSAGAMAMPAHAAIDLVSPRLVTFPADLRADEVTVVGRVGATLTHDASSTRVRFYSLDR